LSPQALGGEWEFKKNLDARLCMKVHPSYRRKPVSSALLLDSRLRGNDDAVFRKTFIVRCGPEGRAVRGHDGFAPI